MQPPQFLWMLTRLSCLLCAQSRGDCLLTALEHFQRCRQSQSGGAAKCSVILCGTHKCRCRWLYNSRSRFVHCKVCAAECSCALQRGVLQRVTPPNAHHRLALLRFFLLTVEPVVLFAIRGRGQKRLQLFRIQVTCITLQPFKWSLARI